MLRYGRNSQAPRSSGRTRPDEAEGARLASTLRSRTAVRLVILDPTRQCQLTTFGFVAADVGGVWGSAATGAILLSSAATFSAALTEGAVGDLSALDDVFATGKAPLLSLMLATLVVVCKAAASCTARELIVGLSASTTAM
jgi:hypothetical protein